MRGSHIKRNDTVIAVAGASTGKTGKVLEVLPSRGVALVEGLNLQKKTLRKSQDNPQGGISDKEGPIALSNLLLYCPNEKKGVRVGRVREGRQLVRKCRLCGHAFDA